MGCLRSCLGRIVLFVLLVAAAYAGWRWGPAVFPRVEGWLGRGEVVEGPAPSPELADSTLARLRRFQDDPREEATFDGVELTSVLRHSAPGLLPAGFLEPTLEMDGGRAVLRGRLVLEAFPRLPDLGPVLGILPDTVGLKVEARLLPFGPGEAMVLVERVEASRIPLPRRMIPAILDALGREARRGLPPEGIVVPLPPGVSAAYIDGDRLVLTPEG